MLAVAARELRERWLLFPAGLVLGLITLALPAFGIRADKAPVVGLLIAILLGAVAALVIGSSMLARDAADGRLGFLFSRPVPWPAIWGGKWLAALVLVAGSASLAVLPWILVHPPDTHGGSWRAVLLDLQGSTFFVLLLLMGVGLANFNATAFRSRSAWLVLDLGLLLLAIWAVRQWVAPLYALQIVWPFLSGQLGFLFLVGPIALALVLASAAQVALGRTDLRRAHRAMSVAFWAVVFVSLAGAGLRLTWALGAQPSDLTVDAASPDPSGRWLCVSGRSRRGGTATFLIDTESGRYLPLGLQPRWGVSSFLGMAFAADGRTGALLRPEGDGSALAVADLGGDEPRFHQVRLESSPPPSGETRLTLSASGSTALLVHEHGVSLFGLPSGRRIAMATVPPGWRPRAARLLGESAARVWLVPGIDAWLAPLRDEMRILEIAVGREPRMTRVRLAAAIDPARTLPFQPETSSARPYPDSDGARVLTRDGGVRLRDGATGALIATLVEGSAPVGAPRVSAGFLADGRIVVGEPAGTRFVLRVFTPDGTPLGDTTVDRVPMGLAVGPEVAPGRVAVSFGSWHQRTTLIVDIDVQRVLETLPPGQRPLSGYRRLEVEDKTRSTQLFEEDGSVVWRDLVTGERRVVVGPGTQPGERINVR
jgi:hypothetical protein